ncbi:MAG: hypothetical protein AMQ74_00739 [Candidatus Methanofastidiosum methylothiophilum]|uniref:LamG-like jellyroll fold domain-containing protein n=1 Tax=Candidatus Methanofastidiosum methylothiophilum TaxID=1705564 RepID=A0A150J5K5_9EURY|nr:MAG: hypothetical protein AMQ74_00739 [Candidatus Methanofastidiosum methylthiophilus]NMC76531.1 LamG domain-containing protein [Candidatus Methanofastidiosa archaeon]
MFNTKFITFVVLLFLTSAFFILPFSADNWHSSDHKARFLFVINHNFIEEDMVDFPVLFKALSESDTYWQSKGNDDGNDLRIFTIDGIECPYEVVKYDPVNYEYIVYFKAPLIKRYTDTEFYIYTAYSGEGNFENPKNVWKNAAGIYHLEGDKNPRTIDSLLDNNATAMNGALPVKAVIGEGYRLDGTNDYLVTKNSLGNNVDYGFSNTLTVMTWANWAIPPSTGNNWANVLSINANNAGDQGQFWIQHSQTNSYFEFAVQTGNNPYTRRYIQCTKGSPKQGQWYFIVGRYDGSAIDIYINNNLGGCNRSLVDNIRAFESRFETNIGRWAAGGGGRYFNGVVDEVWIFKDVKSYPFIKAIYNNATNYNNFTSKSQAEKIPEAVIKNITKPELKVVKVIAGDIIIAKTDELTGEDIGIKGEHITKVNYNGKEVSAVRFTKGTHEVKLDVSNFGMFTQRDVKMRVEGLPKGASAIFSPQNQIIRTKETVSFNAVCTINPEVPEGVYKYTLILYNNLGILGQREIYLFVE